MLTYLLAKKELTPHEANMNVIEMFMAGVDTVGDLHYLYSMRYVQIPKCMHAILGVVMHIYP